MDRKRRRFDLDAARLTGAIDHLRLDAESKLVITGQKRGGPVGRINRQRDVSGEQPLRIDSRRTVRHGPGVGALRAGSDELDRWFVGESDPRSRDTYRTGVHRRTVGTGRLERRTQYEPEHVATRPQPAGGLFLDADVD